jgi:hypothetical protein
MMGEIESSLQGETFVRNGHYLPGRFLNSMVRESRVKFLAVALTAMGIILLGGAARNSRAQDASSDHGPTNVTVYVKEADTGEPIGQAAVTLQFIEPVSFGHGKKHAYNSKTDAQGRCKLFEINKGPITLMVTAPHHQAYGKQLQLDHDNQVFEVKLKKPQPLL